MEFSPVAGFCKGIQRFFECLGIDQLLGFSHKKVSKTALLRKFVMECFERAAICVQLDAK